MDWRAPPSGDGLSVRGSVKEIDLSPLGKVIVGSSSSGICADALAIMSGKASRVVAVDSSGSFILSHMIQLFNKIKLQAIEFD